ncbi:MAG TPA: ATP-binding protein [Candidatus Levilactobacillus faecigallinarum]|uniref:ATP-binding protein n=1 Tax=Candidatus Levilactobacillus faecigallinarum TaxID=2838638 RepID=A0A9D1U6N8_9LACO|nr:ATP-binding protein [Candidatus Levilactobacillus faecigallinarum]
MEESTSKGPIHFALLDQVQKLSQKCPRHHVPMIRLTGKEPFCPECQKEKIAQRSQEIAQCAENYWHRRKTTGVLERDSIFDDPDLKNATFKNYDESVSTEASANWDAARKVAYQYIATLKYKKEQEEIRRRQKEHGDKVQKMDTSMAFNTLFTGLPGRGKSHLALSILDAVNEHAAIPVSCLFVSVNEVMRLIKDSFNFPDSRYTENNMVDLLGNVDLLVLDDLGSEASFKRDNREASEFVQSVLYGILNQRNCTIITTNLNSHELNDIYNPKLLSRIEKKVKGHIIKFTEMTPDRRGVEF